MITTITKRTEVSIKKAINLIQIDSKTHPDLLINKNLITKKKKLDLVMIMITFHMKYR